MMDSPNQAPAAARPRTALLVAALMMTTTLVIVVSQGCRTAPISGRKQLVLIPEAQEIQLGLQAFEETLTSEPLSQDQQIQEMVDRVGRRIAAVANKPEYDWEFRVVAKDVQNAFALPGGKVAVYEGILPVCQSEAGLAVVMSHEVAHALARHGGERMSHQIGTELGGKVISAVSERNAGEATTQKIMQVYGASSQYGLVLPFSRKHESEADSIGLILMAKAGYDPSVAPEFWERFSAMSGDKPPEWLSTHPADARRAADLRALLPEAMKYYKAAQDKIGMGEPIPLAGLTRNRPEPVAVTQQPQPADKNAASQTYLGSISALTGKRTGKPSSAAPSSDTTIAATMIDEEFVPVSADIPEDDLDWATGKVVPADFQLPVKSSATSSTDEPMTNGPKSFNAGEWVPTEKPNPFE